jgi:DNA polymerase elongation subunit (family B)
MSEKEGGELRKKAYAYYSLVNQKLMIKGFEAIRTDLSPLTKKTQENLFYILLKEKNPEKKAVLYLKKVIKKIKEEDESNLLGQVLYSGIIKRKPSKYKSTTPAIGAFLHYCKVYNQNPEILFSEFPRFPYAITIGKRNDPLFKKARHPDIIINQQLRIDRTFYIEEILRIAERFELKNPIDYQTSLLDYL